MTGFRGNACPEIGFSEASPSFPCSRGYRGRGGSGYSGPRGVVTVAGGLRSLARRASCGHGCGRSLFPPLPGELWRRARLFLHVLPLHSADGKEKITQAKSRRRLPVGRNRDTFVPRRPVSGCCGFVDPFASSPGSSDPGIPAE